MFLIGSEKAGVSAARAARHPDLGPWILAAFWVAHAAAIMMLWGPVLQSMFHVWWTDPGASHGLLVPPLAAYLIWIRRDITRAQPASIDARGLLLIAGAGLVLFAGKLGAELFFERVSFVALLAGMFWTFWGLQRLRTLRLPLLLLVTMIPLPTLVYAAVSARLQLLASWIAANIAERLGVSVFVEGNIIQLATVSLGVAEACSGLRSLSSLVIAALLIAVLRLSRLGMRVVLVLCAVPIAIACNVLRIAGTAILADHHPELAMGFYHAFSGWLVFVAGTALTVVCAQLLRRLSDSSPAVPVGKPEPAEKWGLDYRWPAGISLTLLSVACAAVWYSEGIARCSPAMPIESLDRSIGGWTAVRYEALTQDDLDVLKPTAYLLRDYRRKDAELELLIVFFAHQEAGETWHSPRLCLPGDGWEITDSAAVELGPQTRINNVRVRKSGKNYRMLYWYQSQDQVFTNEYLGKILLVRNAILSGNTSGSMVRIILPETPEALADGLVFAKPLMEQVRSLLHCGSPAS